MDDPLHALAAFMQRHRHVLVLTGAGMSTASGIPGYRDEEGVRRGNPPVQGPEFRKHASVRQRYWARSMIGYPRLAAAQANQGHIALARLGAAGHLGTLMTQNVDGLHQRGGSSGVLELHGSIHAVVCLDCHASFARSLVQEMLEVANPGVVGEVAAPLPDGDANIEPDLLARFDVPHCLHCGGTLKPDVVFFGDGVPVERTAQAFAAMAQADALLVVGSSLMVFSGFRFCRAAAQDGKPIAAINLGKTRADDMLSLKVEAPAETALPALAHLLGARACDTATAP